MYIVIVIDILDCAHNVFSTTLFWEYIATNYILRLIVMALCWYLFFILLYILFIHSYVWTSLVTNKISFLYKKHNYLYISHYAFLLNNFKYLGQISFSIILFSIMQNIITNFIWKGCFKVLHFFVSNNIILCFFNKYLIKL